MCSESQTHTGVNLSGEVMYIMCGHVLCRMEEKKEPRLSYRERKAREQLGNASDNRKKWENREEESGDKQK